MANIEFDIHYQIYYINMFLSRVLFKTFLVNIGSHLEKAAGNMLYFF